MREPAGGPRRTPMAVCAVTVTYGNRADLCRQAISAALAAGVEHVVVVDNGSDASAAVALAAFTQRLGGLVTVIAMRDNAGSAAGFAAGIRAALARRSTQAVWLLDDDNVPDTDALSELLRWYEVLRESSECIREPVALLSYRPARRYQRLTVAGVAPSRAYPSRASFLSFHVVDYARRITHRAVTAVRLGRRRAAPTSERCEPVAVPYGPFGGLLLERGAVDQAGLPDERLVLYEDDADFTARLVHSGTGLYLVPSSRIREVDTSWYAATPGVNPFSRLLRSPSTAKLYYGTRNRVYFEKRYWRGSRCVRAFNRTIFMTGLWLTATVTSRRTALEVMRQAVRDGERGRLGSFPPRLKGDSSCP